jgi:hypothetical protein
MFIIGTGSTFAQVAVQGQARGLGGGLGHGHAHPEDGVGAQRRLVARAVEAAEQAVDLLLATSVHAEQFGGDSLVDVGDRLGHALAQIDVLVAVAEFTGLVLAGGRAAGHAREPDEARFQFDLDLDRGVAPRIEDLTRLDRRDFERHGGDSESDEMVTGPAARPGACPDRTAGSGQR